MDIKENKFLCYESFIYIAQKILNKNGNVYTKETHPSSFEFLIHINMENPEMSFSEYMFYLLIVRFQYFNSNKEIGLFDIVRETETNLFIIQDEKKKILANFCKIQKIARAFSRLAFLYKYKKAPLQINTDLYFTPISDKDKNVITVFQNGKKYLFTLVDIKKIIQNSICNSDSFFSSPMSCKNPYNKMVFSKSTLYNIYFFMKRSHCIMPEIIQRYFLSDFHLKRFQDENNYLIRDYAIRNYIHNLSDSYVLNYTREMLDMYNRSCSINRLNIRISKSFPNEKLIKIFKPYLYIYLFYVYSNNVEVISLKRVEFLCKLYAFAKYNPKFGKQYRKMTRNLSGKSHIEIQYNDDCIPFYEKDTVFLKSHEEYIDTISNMTEASHYVSLFTEIPSRISNTHIRFVYNEDIYTENEHDDDDDYQHDDDYQEEIIDTQEIISDNSMRRNLLREFTDTI
jgi:hypothetical protein